MIWAVARYSLGLDGVAFVLLGCESCPELPAQRVAPLCSR